MKNPALGYKLELCAVSLPTGYGGKMRALDISSGVRGFAEGIMHNIDMLTSGRGEPLNALQVANSCITLITHMMQGYFAKTQVQVAFEHTPEYLTIMISNEFVRQDAIRYFNEEMSDLVTEYVKRS